MTTALASLLSGRAVKELEDVGIESFTIAKLFGMDKRSKLDRIKGLFGFEPSGLFAARGESCLRALLQFAQSASRVRCGALLRSQ